MDSAEFDVKEVHALGRDRQNTSQDCGICLQPLPGDLTACINGCVHRFCLNCICRWARIKTSCPLCRSAFNTCESLGGKVLRYETIPDSCSEGEDEVWTEDESDISGSQDQSDTEVFGEDEDVESDESDSDADGFVVADNILEYEEVDDGFLDDEEQDDIHLGRSRHSATHQADSFPADQQVSLRRSTRQATDLSSASSTDHERKKAQQAALQTLATRIRSRQQYHQRSRFQEHRPAIRSSWFVNEERKQQDLLDEETGAGGEPRPSVYEGNHDIVNTEHVQDRTRNAHLNTSFALEPSLFAYRRRRGETIAQARAPGSAAGATEPEALARRGSVARRSISEANVAECKAEQTQRQKAKPHEQSRLARGMELCAKQHPCEGRASLEFLHSSLHNPDKRGPSQNESGANTILAPNFPEIPTPSTSSAGEDTRCHKMGASATCVDTRSGFVQTASVRGGGWLGRLKRNLEHADEVGKLQASKKPTTTDKSV